MNKVVFFSSAFFIISITLLASAFPDQVGRFFKLVQLWLIHKTSWIYILSVGAILFLSLWLMVSRFGEIKLGPDHSVPSYHNISWFAMLFSAGMGIGLLFFGVAEPMMHFSSPPVGQGGSIESAREALKITFFHWGLHGWAVYALFAAILAYFSYRKNLPLLPRSAFHPFLGKKIFGPIGDIIDTSAIIGTMFGVATSLGIGVMQVNAGLHYLFGVQQSMGVQIGLIVGITLLATISVVLGLDGGIKKLSNINMVLACVLLLTILLMSDSVQLMQAFVQNTGAYLSDIIYKTFNLYAYDPKESWIGGWTLLYWGWWIAWAPFVGIFIARISRGRTIREFMAGVLFIPSGFTFLWMTVFGNTAISLTMKGHGAGLVEAVSSNIPVSLFKFFEFFPFSTILSLLGLILVVTFFVSSSDSGSLVIDTLASGGKGDPPVWQRIFWAFLEGAVAAALLVAGGLEALQTMTITSAFPLIFLILFGSVALIKSLQSDYRLKSAVRDHHTTIQYTKALVSWKDRIASLATMPTLDDSISFLENVAKEGLRELQRELTANGYIAILDESAARSIALIVQNTGVEDFYYRIQLRSFDIPQYAPEEGNLYYRAEVFLRSGSQNYDVYGYTKEQVVADAITQYEKHSHFLHMDNTY